MHCFLRELNSRIELYYLGTAFGTGMNPAKFIGIIRSDLPLFLSAVRIPDNPEGLPRRRTQLGLVFRRCIAYQFFEIPVKGYSICKQATGRQGVNGTRVQIA